MRMSVAAIAALTTAISIGIFSNDVHAAEKCMVVGTWNLEHFKDGARRGFPERMGSSQAIPGRTNSDLEAIAVAIRDTMQIRLLTLQEINGKTRTNGSTYSPELDRLLSYLGSTFEYRIGNTGGKQRIAFLWDKRYVKANRIENLTVPETLVGGSDIFDRDPLLGHFSLLNGTQPKADFLFVGLHLKSGQRNTANHDAAMERLLNELKDLKGTSAIYPSGEEDVLIAGDMNASRYDNYREGFWGDMEDADWVVMEGKGYPQTRVNGSQIDYIFALDGAGAKKGMIKEEIDDDEAVVHMGLAKHGRFRFREVYSDHYPVTTCIKFAWDND